MTGVTKKLMRWNYSILWFAIIMGMHTCDMCITCIIHYCVLGNPLLTPVCMLFNINKSLSQTLWIESVDDLVTLKQQQKHGMEITGCLLGINIKPNQWWLMAYIYRLLFLFLLVHNWACILLIILKLKVTKYLWTNTKITCMRSRIFQLKMLCSGTLKKNSKKWFWRCWTLHQN